MNTNDNVSRAPWTPATADEIKSIRAEIRGDAGNRWVLITLPRPWRRADLTPASGCTLRVGTFLTVEKAQREVPRAVAAVTYYLLTGSTDAVLTEHNHRGGLASQLSSLRRDAADPYHGAPAKFERCEECGEQAVLNSDRECHECAAFGEQCEGDVPAGGAQ